MKKNLLKSLSFRPVGLGLTLIAVALITSLINNQPAPQHAEAASKTAKPAATTTAAPTSGNLLLNPSFENKTSNWSKGSWGSNQASFTYENGGHSGAHSATVRLAKYKNGDAKWIPQAVNVKPATSYTFTDWYKSSVPGQVDAVVTTTDGQTTYLWLADTPASSAWKQVKVTFNTPANAKKITFYHLINKNGSLTVDDYDFQLTPPADTPGATTPPTTPTIPSPTPNPAPNPIVTPPTTPTPPVTPPQQPDDPIVTPPTPPAPTAPTVNIITPAANATVSGTQNLGVNVSDAQGVASVQYKLDGQNLGGPLTSAPYSFSWDTTGVANGVHTLTAVATNVANLSTTSAVVNVTVNNQAPTPPADPTNLIPNPSLETADSTGGSPQSWTASSWGTNNAVFSYPVAGHSGDRGASVTVSNYTNGAADWSYAAQPVTPGHYRYTDWYKSDVTTEVDYEMTVNGVTQSYYLGVLLPSTDWKQAAFEIDVPAGATSITIYHLIAANGTLTTDDFSFGTYVPAQLTRGLVSLTFDDGWTNQYDNAKPLLASYGLPATFYIISGELTDQPEYMSALQVQGLIADGHEIGSHTIHHCDLTGQQTDDPVNCPLNITPAQIQNEMQQSQVTLQNAFNVPVTSFAYPYGAYDANSLGIGNSLYVSQRTVQTGFNTKDNMNFSQLLVQNIYNTTTPAQVQAWVDQAIAQHSWLILVYHEVATVPTDPTDVQYNTQPADLAAELSYIKNSGVAVKTVQQAITEIQPQL